MNAYDSERIDRLERTVDYLTRYLGIDPAHIIGGIMPPGAPAGQPAFGDLPPGVDVAPPNEAADVALAPVYDALRRRNTIEAIKIYRQMTGASLAEAKSVVEQLARQL